VDQHTRSSASADRRSAADWAPSGALTLAGKERRLDSFFMSFFFMDVLDYNFRVSTLIVAHVVTGLAGIALGLICIAGIFYRKSMDRSNVAFLLATAMACGTGLVFLPISGVTSAQLVAFFLTFLLSVAAYARYVRHLEGSWNSIYALTAVGAVYLNVLITTAQFFLHVRVLKELAPTQDSPIYVAVKLVLLLLFIVIALFAAKRAGQS
jgi:hypothetical protein